MYNFICELLASIKQAFVDDWWHATCIAYLVIFGMFLLLLAYACIWWRLKVPKDVRDRVKKETREANDRLWMRYHANKGREDRPIMRMFLGD
jgi:Flp pilus assembly protein TadB